MKRYKLNRRGAVLLLFGFLNISVGLSTAMLPLPAVSRETYAVALQFASVGFWGYLWASIGMFGIVSAWLPTRRDDLGFYAMALFMATWAAMALASSIIYDAPRGWISAVIYGTFTLLLVVVSGMDRDE